MSIKIKFVLTELIIVCLMVGCTTDSSNKADGTREMETVVNSLTEGMTFSQVVALLDQKEVEYSTYESEPIIRGIFRRVDAGTRLAERSVQFYLFFDQNGQLERKEFEDIFTGM